MASRIKLKRSLTPNSAPTTSDLTDKEVALNIIDRTLFVNNAGTIEEIANADPNDEKIVPSMFSSAITDGVGNTWYVSTNGTDKATLGSVNPRHGETTGANAWGKTPSTAFASLKYALDNYAQSGDTILVSTGTYTEVFPLTVPVGVTIKGEGLKSTFIQPTSGTNTEDAFLIEGDCNIEDLCVTGFYYDGVGDTGYAFRLKSTYAVADGGRRPYIQRVSVITKGSTTSGADPYGYAAGDAGRGALVDGSIVDVSSTEAALLFNECTFVVPNSVGLYLKNGARCEWLNSFTYFAADSIKGENPGGSGFKGAGRTRLKLNGVLGTFNASDTITYYDVDGTTILASGTIDENDGTYIYIDGQGTGQFVEAESQTAGKLVTANGDAQLDQDIKYFGTASLLLDGTGDYLSLAGSSDFGFGTSDFTVEAFVRPTTVTGTAHIYDSRSGAGDVAGRLYLENGQVRYAVGGSDIVTSGATTLSASTWYHVAVVRNSSTTKIYIDGVERGSAADSNDLGSSRALYIGANFAASNLFTGNIDEFRVSKGLARYTSTPFTVTTSEFIVDTNTQLLLHFNGLDGSTDILDGSVSVQDVRSSSGGTAGYITLADYTDFGAELRSIGSASVYGERGITADGKGVRLRCIVHNFGYVGVGADASNDISGVNQANEIVEANGGRALFTSMDQNGDFRVGNAFFVDQENGTVSFVGGTSGGGTTFDQLIVTGTGDTTTILPTSITVGTLTLSGDDIVSSTGEITISPLNVSNINIGVTGPNEIDTDSGDLILDSASGDTIIDDNLEVTGNLTFGGTVTSNATQLFPNGSVSSPSIAFNSQPNVGIYRPGSFKLGFAVENQLIASVGDNAYDPGDDIFNPLPSIPSFNFYKGFNNYVDTAIGAVTLTNGGSGYSVEGINPVQLNQFGTIVRYDNVDLVSSTGSGDLGTANITVESLAGSVTNSGSNYIPGFFNGARLLNDSRRTNTVVGNINAGGGGYTAGTYTNVPMVGGSGNGMEATIVTSAVGIETEVTSVTITNVGTGYQSGDIVTANTSDIGGTGSGFNYILTTYTSVASGAIGNITIDGIVGTITNGGSGYVNGTFTAALTGTPVTGTQLGTLPQVSVDIFDGEVFNVTVNSPGSTIFQEGTVLTFDDPNFDGVGAGTNFAFTITEYGRVSNVEITDGGEGYLSTDILTLEKLDLNGVTTSISNGGSGYTAGVYENVLLTGGSGSGAIATITTTGADLISGTIAAPGSGYTQGTYNNVTVRNYPTQTFIVTLVGSTYYIDTVANPTLTLVQGNTYRFDISDSSLSSAGFDIDATTGSLPTTISKLTVGGAGTANSFIELVIGETTSTSTSLTYLNPTTSTPGNTVSITTGTAGTSGNSALADVTINSSGQVTSFAFVVNGNDYKVGDSVTIVDPTTPTAGNGFEFEITSIVPNASVSNVQLISAGYDYVTGETLSATNTDIGGTGSGFQLDLDYYNSGSNFDFTVSGAGKVTAVDIVDRGFNYGVNDQLTIDNLITDQEGSGLVITVSALQTATSALMNIGGELGVSRLKISSTLATDLEIEDADQVPLKLLVDGKSLFSDTLELGNGRFDNLALTFESNKEYGIYYETQNSLNYLSVRTEGGKALSFGNGIIRAFSSSDAVLTEIDTFTIAGGSGYTQGTYNNVELLGGSGTGAVGTVVVGFSGSIVNPGSGYYPASGSETFFNVTVTGGSGSNAAATVVVTDGGISSFILTDAGTGYQVGDILGVDATTVTDGVNGGTGAGFEYVVTGLGSVTSVTLSSSGLAYQVNDVLNFNPTDTNFSNGNGFSLTVSTVNTTTQSEFDITTGLLKSTGLASNGDGVLVDDTILLSGSTITRSTVGDLTLGTTNGFVGIGGTGAFGVPRGTTGERPAPSNPGYIRYNTTESRFEGFNGSYFVSLGGVRDVDGNTYISAELNPGDNDNTIRFFNNGTQSLQVEETKITLQSIADIEITNVSSTTEWVAGATATAPADPQNDPAVFVYYNENVYRVDTTGTFDSDPANAPTHTTGTVTNGTVDLTWSRTIFGSLTNKASEIDNLVDSFTVNTTAIKLGGNTTTSTIGSESTSLALTLTAADHKFITFGSAGTLSVNTTFGDVDPGTGENVETYVQVLDKDLQTINLKDTRIKSGTTTIDTSVGNAASITLFPYTEGYSGKFMVEIYDDSSTPRRQYSEVSYLVTSDGVDILYTESNKIYTDVVLCNVEANLSGGDITVLVTDVTGSSTLVHSIKVVSQAVLA